MAVFLFGLVVASAYAASEIFSGRAAYLQVGAMLGTIMAANVLFNIIPAHWELIRAKERGESPDPAPALEAKRRSVHNNYLTLPVVFTMISNHFAFTYGHDHAWLVLVALVVIGAWVRHFFNLRHAGRNAWWIPVTAAAAVVCAGNRDPPDEGGGTDRPSRCPTRGAGDRPAALRSVPRGGTDPGGFETAPVGVAFDSVEETEARAEAIKAQAVDSNAMPLGNVTGMTDEEREQLGAWIDALEVGSRRARDHGGPVLVRRALRGGAGAADGRRVPRDPPARGPDHPLPLERRVELDPVGRPRPRDRPRERDVVSAPRRDRALPGRAKARRSFSSPTATATSRARPASCGRTTSRRSSRARSS